MKKPKPRFRVGQVVVWFGRARFFAGQGKPKYDGAWISEWRGGPRSLVALRHLRPLTAREKGESKPKRRSLRPINEGMET